MLSNMRLCFHFNRFLERFNYCVFLFFDLQMQNFSLVFLCVFLLVHFLTNKLHVNPTRSMLILSIRRVIAKYRNIFSKHRYRTPTTRSAFFLSRVPNYRGSNRFTNRCIKLIETKHGYLSLAFDMIFVFAFLFLRSQVCDFVKFPRDIP